MINERYIKLEGVNSSQDPIPRYHNPDEDPIYIHKNTTKTMTKTITKTIQVRHTYTTRLHTTTQLISELGSA